MARLARAVRPGREGLLNVVIVAGDVVTVWSRDGTRHGGVLRLLGEDVVVLRCGEAIRYLAARALVAVSRPG